MLEVLSQGSWIHILWLLLVYGVGILHVVHALMHVRTSQGTVAWVVSLMSVPFVAIPLYWLLGRNRFSREVGGRREQDERLSRLTTDMEHRLRDLEVVIPGDNAFERAAEILGGLPFTRGNDLRVLIDGTDGFERIFHAIERSTKYICVNFYIVKNDRLGKRFQQALIDRARQGVRVYFLFDELGSHKLPDSYLQEMRDAGIQCHFFGVNRFWWSRLQINFRNHRKVLIADGDVAFIGGLNVGDEYLGRSRRFGPWRDTHLEMMGPLVQAVQRVFLEDWYWAAEEFPELCWEAGEQPANEVAAIIPTGPADPAESWQLLVAEAANTSRKRLWVTSPYFVPDSGVMTSLQAAAIRGVDVRVLIPERPDHLLVWLSAFAYYPSSIPYGIRIFRYTRGFLHQKVMLIDDRMASVGTANLDNRSFRLNFEITAFSPAKRFVGVISDMLEEDFTHAREVELKEFTQRPFWFRAACRAARLLAPIQ